MTVLTLISREMESEKRLMSDDEDCLNFLTTSECNAKIPRGSESYGKQE